MKLPRADRGGAAAQGQAVARGTATKEGGQRATDPVAMGLCTSGGPFCPRPMLRPGPGAAGRRTRAPATRREIRHPVKKERPAQLWSPGPPGNRIDAPRSARGHGRVAEGQDRRLPVDAVDVKSSLFNCQFPVCPHRLTEQPECGFPRLRISVERLEECSLPLTGRQGVATVR